MLRGDPEPVPSSSSADSLFDKKAAALAQDTELDKIFVTEEAVPVAPPVAPAEPEEKARDLQCFLFYF